MRIRRAHLEIWPRTVLAASLLVAGSRLAGAQEPQVTPSQATQPPASPLRTQTLPDAPALKPSPAPVNAATAIAIVPVEGVELTGALDVSDGKAIIAKSGTVTAGKRTATVTLPHRGQLLLCATSKVNLTTDSSVQTASAPADVPGGTATNETAGTPGNAPGLMIAIDRGALEAKFATGKNSDVVLTPDFRILISGPGVADVQVRLAAKGDTCVDNSGPDAPYVAVSSVFDGGVYRVQAGQRVMFQHGSLTEVVDNERESCGCPPEPPTIPTGNEFPIAQSAGLAPVLPAIATKAGEGSGGTAPQIQATLTHNAGEPTPSSDTKPETAKPPTNPKKADAVAPSPTLADAAADAARPAPKPLNMGPAHRFGRFLKRLFGG